VTSSPYHSQSNGKAESAVKIAKLLLKKARKDDTNIHLAILNWRNTPTEGSKYSPSQKLHSRRTRTTIPTTNELLQPEVAKNVSDEICIRCQHTKLWYDRTAKALPELVIGQGVRMQPLGTGGQWKRATVIKKVGERSYLTQNEEDQVYRRNCKYLRVTNEESSRVNEESSRVPEHSAEDSVLPPKESVETTANQSTMSSEKVQTETTEQKEGSTEDTPSAEYMTTRSGRCVKPPTRYRDYTNSS